MHVPRRWLLLVVVAVPVAAISWIAVVSNEAQPWVKVGSVEDVRSQRIVYLSDEQIFGRDSFIAVSAAAPHVEGERVLYCRSSGWFIGQHGEMFDSRGYYAGGPAHSGLSRVDVRLLDGEVEVNPEVSLGAPARGAEKPEKVGSADVVYERPPEGR